MKSIFYSTKKGILILILLSAALCRFNGAAAYPGETESRIDALDRFEMKLSELTVDPEKIRFTLTLSGNGVESEEDCEERYVEGVREDNGDGEARLCRTVRQEFAYFNGGVIPADAEIVKTTLSFDGYNYFQIDPEGQESGKPDPIWTQYGYKVKINFYRPDAVQFDEYGHEKTDSDLLRGYPTNESFGIYLADFEWGIYQIAIALNYRADYFNPHFATIPVKSTDDDYFHGFGGAEVIDGKPVSVSGGPTVADLIENGEFDPQTDLPENPVVDALVIYAYRDPRFKNGHRSTSWRVHPVRIDAGLSGPNVILTYRTKQGGIGHWIGSIQNQLRIQYVYKSE